MPLTWTQQATPTTYNNQWLDICWSPELSLFVAVGRVNSSGTASHRIMTSPDGVTWTSRDSGVTAANSWGAVCWSPELSLFVAVKQSGTNRVSTSPDGLTWTDRADPGATQAPWVSVAWSASLGLFVALGSRGTASIPPATHDLMTSPDGLAWTGHNILTTGGWQKVIWCAGLGMFLATRVDGGVQTIYSSTDGLAWTLRLTDSSSGASSADETWIAWSEDLGMAAAVIGRGDDPIYTSINGTAWTQRTAPTTGANRPIWKGLVGGAFGFIGVGQAGSTNTNQIIESADGVTWTESDPAVATVEPWSSIAWGADRVVALANNTNNDGLSVMTSPAPALTVTAIDPADGLTIGGTAVTITGTGFVDGAEINFDNVAATDVVVVSPTSITCVTPAHVAGVVDVTVTLLPSGAYGTLVATFTYLAYGIASVTPDHGPVTGDTAVTIAGLGFTVDALITFGGLEATDVVFVDETAYTCTTPAHTVGPVTVAVGDSELAEAFTYEALDVDGPTLPDDDETWTGKVRTDPAPSLSSSHHGIRELTFTTRESGEVPAGQIIGLDFGDGPLFQGPVVTTDLTFVGTATELAQQHHAVDFAWDLNARRPFGTWTEVSVSTIVAQLLAAFAPDFTGSGVAAGLPVVTILLDGSATFTEALTALCEAMGGGAFWLDVRDLHLFQDPEAGTEPDVIAASTPSFLHDAPVTLTEDITQLGTRVHGKGAGSVTRALAIAGDTSIEVGSLENFESGGGLALVGSQVVAYTGTAKVAEAARRAATSPTGPGGGMTLLPSLLGDTPWDNGNIRTMVAYKLAFVDERGRESALSPAAQAVWIPPIGPSGGSIPVSYTTGFMDAGGYSYVFSQATAEGETNGSAGSSGFGVSVGAGAGVIFTNIPTNIVDERVLTIRIYRTKRGQMSPYYQVGEIPNTELNTFTDVLNDASLTSPNFNIAPRTINTTGGKVYLSDIPPCPDPVPDGPVQPSFGPLAGGTAITVTGRGFIAGLNVYVGGTIATDITFINDTTYTATVPAGSGTADVTVGTPGDEAGYLHVAEGFFYTDTDARAKRIYRAEYDGHHLFRIVDPYTLIATLTPDETTYLDDTPTRPPGLYDSELDDTDTLTPVTDTTARTPPTWHYLLTGIPASGEGALTAPVLVDTPVNIWIQRDDIAAQAAFALRHGGSGVRERRVTDTNLRTAALIRRVDAELALWKDPVRTVKYATRDPKSTIGSTVTFALDRPPIAGDFLIQTVGASLTPNLTTDPLLSVTASSVRFTLEDLLRRVVLKDEDRAGAGSGAGSSSSSSSEGPAPPVWGDIDGALSSQTDLVAALAAKASTTHAATHAFDGDDPLSVLDLDGFPGGTTDYLRADGSFATPAGGGGGAWGGITGTLSDQTDLAAALAGKASTTHTHAEADVTGLGADLALKAPLASPALTGTPTAPTAAAGTNTTQVATTAYTRAEIAALIASSPATLDTLNELAAALGNDPNFAATMATALGLKAPLASPTFTGVPAAPTAAPGTNTTQLATTAFVATATAAGGASLAKIMQRAVLGI